jgi:hypothetical protein
MKINYMLIVFLVVVCFPDCERRFAHENSPDSAQEGLPFAIFPWHTRYIHRQVTPTSVDVGDYNSIAFNPNDNLPYISYYNTTNQDLMLASPNPSGTGNCGDGGDWWCRAVDGDGLEGRSTDDTGQYSSIAFWKNPGDEVVWKMGISYYNATTHGLRYAV